MSKCINVHSAEFKSLVEISGISSIELAAKVNLWMEDNNTDVWPSLNQLGLTAKTETVIDKTLSKISSIKSGLSVKFDKSESDYIYSILSDDIKSELDGIGITDFNSYINEQKSINTGSLFERIINFVLNVIGIKKTNKIIDSLILDSGNGVLSEAGQMSIYGITKSQKSRAPIINRLMYRAILPGNYDKSKVFKEIFKNIASGRDYEYFVKTLSK